MTDELQKKVFSQNLRRYLDLSMSTQKEIAAKMGVSPQTFNTWCTGVALPRMGKIQQLADLFGIEKSDLIDIKERTTLPSIKGLKIPVLGRVAAGLPIEAQENILDWEEIPEEWQKKGEYFALEIRGHSMEPIYPDGSKVYVDEKQEVHFGDDGVFILNGEALIKKMTREGLYSYNQDKTSYPTRTIYESDNLKIVGKVIGRVGDFDIPEGEELWKVESAFKDE